MAANRSHHFVPKCYLRNFSTNSGRSIRLFNIARSCIIPSASIKSQCARDRLYGHDELESHLAEIEGKYAEWVTRGILAEPSQIVDEIHLFCKFFALVQYMRTEAHAARMRAHFRLTETLAEIPADSEFSCNHLDLSDSALARDGIMFALELKEQIDDLKLTFIHNKSDVAFITCDDPVVMTNRLYFQRAGDSNFGVGSAGILFYLPLSPSIAMLLYDGDVYTVPKHEPLWTMLRRDADAIAFNEWIMLKARENIYFRDQAHFKQQWFDAIQGRRLDRWLRGRILLPVRLGKTKKLFSVAEKPPIGGGYVIATSLQHPSPRIWPSIIPFRRPAVVYGNGSAMGYVRHGTIPPGAADVVKIKV